MQKSPEAFRTISEVADWLGVPTHVLRFWESRFTQVKPVKRAGGRRYYRPADMLLLGGIKRLLHDDGMTIRGVQKLLREEGVRHVSGFSQPLEAETMIDVTPEIEASPIALDVEPEPVDNVVPIKTESEPEKADEPQDVVPELAFLRRGEAPQEGDEAAKAEDADAGPQADLFTSRRSAPSAKPEEPAAAASSPSIPATPQVPQTDPADDDASIPASPGVALRLRRLARSGRRPDPAVAADARARLARLLESA
jgi:DNA-binding transcriptional MerR regulator